MLVSDRAEAPLPVDATLLPKPGGAATFLFPDPEACSGLLQAFGLGCCE